MTLATMNVFQTYKAFTLKKMWKEDLEELKKAREKIKYRFCLPWKNFVGLSIEIYLLLSVYLLTIGIREKGLSLFPLLILISLYLALQPLVFMVLPLSIYNVIKIQCNKLRNANKMNLKIINQEEEAIKTNLKTIQTALQNNSIVPVKYQTENDLQKIMSDIKDGKAKKEYHAISMHALKLSREEKIREGEKENHQESAIREGTGLFFKNIVLFSLLLYLYKKK